MTWGYRGQALFTVQGGEISFPGRPLEGVDHLDNEPALPPVLEPKNNNFNEEQLQGFVENMNEKI